MSTQEDYTVCAECEDTAIEGEFECGVCEADCCSAECLDSHEWQHMDSDPMFDDEEDE